MADQTASPLTQDQAREIWESAEADTDLLTWGQWIAAFGLCCAGISLCVMLSRVWDCLRHLSGC